jgi:diaminopimelate epimerase
MSAEQKPKINFIKMSGAGNDFVIIDARKTAISLTATQIKKISDRKNIGCDQLIILKSPLKNQVAAKPSEDFTDTNSSALNQNHPSSLRDATLFFKEGYDVEMIIYNSDGSLSGACGNATRCVASLFDKSEIKIKTAAGILPCKREGNLISVNMGKPKFEKNISLYGFDFGCVDVGNPHAVTFIKEKISDEKFFDVGPKVEVDKNFPNKTNVEFARILSDDLIEVRVWERGAGETLACGSGACAVGALAIKENLIKNKKVTTRFKGGNLTISYDGNFVIMTGGYEKNFEGVIDEKILG